MLEISFGIPILLAAIRLAGKVAKLLQVLMAVKEGEILCFQNELTPDVPFAIKSALAGLAG